MRLPHRVSRAACVTLALAAVACAGNTQREHEPFETPAAQHTALQDTDPMSLPDDPRQLMDAALRLTTSGDNGALRKLGQTGDPAYIPVIVELLRFPWELGSGATSAAHEALRALSEGYSDRPETGGSDWEAWSVWLGRHDEVVPPDGFAAWKGNVYSALVDPNVGAFLYDGVPTRIRIEEIAWGGVERDGIPDLTNPPSIPASEADYLLADDRVFGVSFNGEHRAYPLRILNPHEMANDVVGGQPFALAY